MKYVRVPKMETMKMRQQSILILDAVQDVMTSL